MRRQDVRLGLSGEIKGGLLPPCGTLIIRPLSRTGRPRGKAEATVQAARGVQLSVRFLASDENSGNLDDVLRYVDGEDNAKRPLRLRNAPLNLPLLIGKTSPASGSLRICAMVSLICC